jgi:heptosyltransferase I
LGLRFLISRLSSLGDVACSLPAAGILRTAFPESHIVWVVDPRFAGVVESCRFVDEVVAAKPGLAPSSWPGFESAYDAVLDLQGLLKSALAVARAKSRLRLGYHWQREGSWLFSRPVVPDPSSFHIADQYADVARAAVSELRGESVPDRAEFGLEPSPATLHSVREKLDGLGVGNRFVVLNAGAGWATKRWPAGYFAHVADGLAERGMPAVLIGGKAPADREAADAVIQASQSQPKSLLGQTSVPELIALLSFCEAHVGGDTGSTHLAAGLGRPAIGLYSITRPRRSCPYGQVERCHYNPAGLHLIPPGEVLASLEEALT